MPSDRPYRQRQTYRADESRARSGSSRGSRSDYGTGGSSRSSARSASSRGSSSSRGAASSRSTREAREARTATRSSARTSTRSTRSNSSTARTSNRASNRTTTRTTTRTTRTTRPSTRDTRSSRRVSSSDYRYQNIMQSPYGPAIYQESLWNRLRRPVMAVAAVVVVALAAFLVVNAAGSCSLLDDGKAHITVTPAQDLAYEPSAADVLAIPDSDSVVTALLSQDDPGFSVSPAQLARVNAAISQVEELGPCGFVFLDVQTGRALAYNAGEVLYCASAVKAPMAYYVLSQPHEDGGPWDNDYYNIEEAIVWSDNDSYFKLTSSYFDDAYLTWLAAHDVSHESAANDSFPTMNARSLGSIWTDIYLWLKEGSEDAQWLGGLFGQTEESYIRDGLAGTDATVQNKAGWISDGDLYAVVDAGVVHLDGRDYVLAVITGQPDWKDEARPNVARLVRALFDIRGVLSTHVTIEF